MSWCVVGFLAQYGRKSGTAHHLHNTTLTVNCDDGSIMLWGCFPLAMTGGLNKLPY